MPEAWAHLWSTWEHLWAHLPRMANKAPLARLVGLERLASFCWVALDALGGGGGAWDPGREVGAHRPGQLRVC